jgi:NAD(P)-dependent dehydrogenase (short-subunit alcohol dehydrogenase family)
VLSPGAVAPGATDTEMLGVVRHLNIHRPEDIAPPEALAHAILYLCADLAQNVTGGASCCGAWDGRWRSPL